MSVKDGGPAFPTKPIYNDNDDLVHDYDGMTLRDWFAGQALAGIARDTSGDITDIGVKAAAEEAYIYADAMLAAR